MKFKCFKCDKLAIWYYMPGFRLYNVDANTYENLPAEHNYRCDECVDRGCSCNMTDPSDENSEEHKDEIGRLLPCCEWGWSSQGYYIEHSEGVSFNVIQDELARLKTGELTEEEFKASIHGMVMKEVIDDLSKKNMYALGSDGVRYREDAFPKTTMKLVLEFNEFDVLLKKDAERDFVLIEEDLDGKNRKLI